MHFSTPFLCLWLSFSHSPEKVLEGIFLHIECTKLFAQNKKSDSDHTYAHI